MNQYQKTWETLRGTWFLNSNPPVMKRIAYFLSKILKRASEVDDKIDFMDSSLFGYKRKNDNITFQLPFKPVSPYLPFSLCPISQMNVYKIEDFQSYANFSVENFVEEMVSQSLHGENIVMNKQFGACFWRGALKLPQLEWSVCLMMKLRLMITIFPAWMKPIHLLGSSFSGRTRLGKLHKWSLRMNTLPKWILFAKPTWFNLARIPR